MSNVIQYYDQLHAIPERAFEEVKTAAFLAAHLKEFGYEVTEKVAGKTGVVGIYDSGRPGPVVALRADMDALGHIVDGERCAIHSCGHDAHSSVVLAAAEDLIKSGTIQKGKLKIIFQPAEEIAQGAKSIIAGGVIDDVDYIFGSHLRPGEELANGQATPAIYYSSSCHMTAQILGKPAHGARPHLGINAINAAVLAISAVNTIQLKPTEVYSIKATQFIADAGALNAIPAEALVTWDLRSQKNKVMADLQEKARKAIENAVFSIGGKVDIQIPDALPAAEYDDDSITLVQKAIENVLGKKGLVPPIVTPGGEDFFYYKRHKPTVKSGFFGLGCNLWPGLHHPAMSFDKNALETGVAIFKELVTMINGNKGI